jgi:hypothetical protein
MSCPPRPARVLLHPLWIAALVVLAANDQWLKFAELLPPVVTGKLSDFAGMIVAPALFAVVLELKSKRAWWLAHVAVGIVFATLQLSRPFADLWSQLMGAFGFRWSITSDPTDLFALPMLFVSARVLWPAMTVPSQKLARRSAEATAAGVGLMCCVATSREEPPEGWEQPEWLPDITADVWLHNGTGEAQVFRIRPLRDTVQLDCNAVKADPARLLAPALFADVQSWSVPIDATLTVLDHVPGEAPCYAAMVDADAFEPVLLFWFDGQPAQTTVPGLGTSDASGQIELTIDDDGEGSYDANGEILFVRGESSEPTGECAAQDDAYRVDWGDEVPLGQQRINAIVPGVDGCTALDLVDPGDEGDADRMYLCTPSITLPFAVGDAIEVRRAYGVQSEAVVLAKLDESLAPAVPAAELWVSRGADVPALAGLQVSVVPTYACEYAVDDCGTVGRSVGLTLGGGVYESAQLHIGTAPVTLAGDDGSSWTIALAHGQERVVLDSECASGPDGLGYDIELVAVWNGAQ